MKLVIELPDNYAHAYLDMMKYIDDSVTLEESIARESKEFVQRMLYQGWEFLAPEPVYSSTRGAEQEEGRKIAETIIRKHKIKENE